MMDSGGPFGPTPAWHHLECYFENYPEKCTVVEDYAGWENLDAETVTEMREKFASSGGGKVETQEQLPAISKSGVEAIAPSLEEQKKQVQKFWEAKDALKDALLESDLSAHDKKETLVQFLQANNIQVSPAHSTESQLVDIIADVLCFGLGPVCSDCEASRLVWDPNVNKYACIVYHAWGKCPNSIESGSFEPDVVSVPKEVSASFPYFKSVAKRNLMKRVVLNTLEASPAKYHIPTKDDLAQKRIKKSQPTLEQEGNRPAKKAKVLVKGRSVVDPDSGLEDSHHIIEVGGVAYNSVLASSDVSTGRNSYYTIQALEGDWVRTTGKNIAAKKRRGGTGSASYYVFRKWGRVGTNIGGTLVERCDSLDEAIERFEALYVEKTGNEFGAKDFVKKPAMFYPMDLSVPSSEELRKNRVEAGTKSKLDTKVQELLKLIFDMEAMRRALMEMEIDLSKMPLGHISKTQLKHAYEVVSEISQLLDQKQRSQSKLVELSNRFYTLVPHDFGTRKVPILDTKQLVRSKLDMLETLMEIEIATKLLQEEHQTPEDETKDPLDLHYELLGIEIACLDPKSTEFGLIKKYAETTHGPTHKEYTLAIKNIYKIHRQSEFDAFQAYVSTMSELSSNRKLLWHGSRRTNYVGILSQGLRIAPPEAPVTGYMFGKGVYFADVVSKSANYCCTSNDDMDGLVLLSEVALGRQKKLLASEYIERKGRESWDSVMGCGKTVPLDSVRFPSDISAAVDKPLAEKVTQHPPLRRSRRNAPVTANPVPSISSKATIECPMGPVGDTKDSKVKTGSALQYNEYVVYDTRQILTRYLVHFSFNYTG